MQNAEGEVGDRKVKSKKLVFNFFHSEIRIPKSALVDIFHSHLFGLGALVLSNGVIYRCYSIFIILL
jgi:hypothetical protein